MSFFDELKRRNVIRVAIAYGVVSWFLLQLADLVLENIAAPEWVMQALMLVVGIGFPLVIIFAWAFEMTPEGIKKEKDVDRSQSITSQTGRKLDRAIIGILTIVVGYLLVDKLVLQDDGISIKPPGQTSIAETTPPPSDLGLSVAVLPFVNMSDDAGNEYFSDGLTETLLHMLAQLPELRVAARTSSFAFKGKDTGIAEIAETLGVAHILEGSVQKSGDRIRVTAQLIRANDGFHVWSQNYTRPLEDIFAIQDEIATDVANALDESLLGGTVAIRNVEASSLTAYDPYLKALERQALFSYASLPEAESLFKEALAADPGFIDAKLGLARNYIMMRGTGIIDNDTTVTLAEPLLQQALAAEPRNPLARALQLQLGLWVDIQINPQERSAKIQELRNLLPLIPTDSAIRSMVANLLSTLENLKQDALEVIEAGLLVDPLDADLHDVRGQILSRMDRFEEALVASLRADELRPSDPNILFHISETKADIGDLVGMLEYRRRATEADPRDHELASELANDFYDLGLIEEGDRWAAKTLALAPQSDVGRKTALQKAYAHGDTKLAMALARGMIEDQVSIRQNSFATAIFTYRKLIMLAGQEKEAYEFILSVRPELADFETYPGNFQGTMMQQVMISFMSAFKPLEEREAAWLAYTASLDKGFARWREFKMLQVLDQLMQGHLDEAERLTLDVYLAQPIATNPNMVDNIRYPLFAELLHRPAVAARMAEIEENTDLLRDEISEMLLEPEWTQ